MRVDQWWQRSRNDLLALSALLLLLILRFLPSLIGGRLYAPFGDNVFIYGPMFSETARIALQGEHPFYLPGIGMGLPLYQSPHYSPFYPFYFFGLLDYGGPLESLHTLTRLAILHITILALNFFILLRCARVSPWPSFMGASIGIVAHNTEVYAGWITISSSYTWLPLVLAGGVLLFRNPRSVPGIILLGVSSGLLILASASQSVAHALFCSLVLFTSGAVWLFRRGGVRPVLCLLLSLSLAGVIASGIGAVSAVPVYLGIKEMVRHIGNGFVIGHEKIPWEKFSQMQMKLGDLPSILFNPEKLEIVGSPYVGPLGLVGVLCAAWFFPRLDSFGKLLAATIGAIGLYGLLSALGAHLGFAYLNYHLPLLNKIREAGRNLVLFALSAAFLSGVGFDQLVRLNSVEFGRQPRTGTKLVIVGISVLPFLAMVTWELIKRAPLTGGAGLILLLSPTILILGLLFRMPGLATVFFAAFAVSLAALLSPVRTFPVQVGEYSKSTNLQNLRLLSELKNKFPPGPFRVDFADKKTSAFTWSMNASYFGYRSFYNRLTPQPYDQFRFSLQRNPPLLHEMMGGRYVLCAAAEKPDDPTATARFAVNGYTLFENPTYMERLTIAHSSAGTVSSEKEFLDRARRKFDLRQSVCIQKTDEKRLGAFLSSTPGNAGASEDRFDVTRNSANQTSAVLTASRPGVVILNEWFTRAWHARVNGKPKATVRANLWQVGVPVGAGRNIIEFTYRPSLSHVLLIVNRITWLLLGLFLMLWLFRPRMKALERSAT